MNHRNEKNTVSYVDELLAIRCKLGESAAFDELICRFADRLRSHVRRVAASEAEADDLVQDIWVRVLRGLPGLRDPARLRSWLFGIAHRVLMDRLRRRYSAPLQAPVEQLAANVDLQSELIQRDQIERGLSALHPTEREALVLFYLEELSLAEIADALALPIGTVKSRLHRARARLRIVLNDER